MKQAKDGDSAAGPGQPLPGRRSDAGGPGYDRLLDSLTLRKNLRMTF